MFRFSLIFPITRIYNLSVKVNLIFAVTSRVVLGRIVCLCMKDRSVFAAGLVIELFLIQGV